MKTVLVVDDERLIRWSLEQGLKGSYRVLVAADVEEAMQIISTAPVDVLITDLNMPERGGMELIEHVRQHHPHVKVFVITGYGSGATLERCYTLGVDGYIRKPFEIRLIRDMITLHSQPA